MAPRLSKFRFYFDENFPVEAGAFFRGRGHAVLIGRDELGPGKSDVQQLGAAARHDAILVSLDKDFKVDADLSARIADSPGVILYRASAADLTRIRTITIRLLRDATRNSFSRKICIASIDKIRWLS